LLIEGGLQKIKLTRLRELASNGLIGTICPDGNYSQDIFNHIAQFTSRLHLTSLNGGAQLIAPEHPLHERDGRSLIASIKFGWEKGKGKAITLFSHYPCGMAYELGRSPQEVIFDTLSADAYLTQLLELPEEIILPLFHVDWTPEKNDNKRCRTYVIKNKCLSLL